MSFFVTTAELNEDYIHVLDKEWKVSVIEVHTSEVRTFNIHRLACGFSQPTLSRLIDKIEGARKWEEIEALNQHA